MNARAANRPKVVARGRRKNTTAWIRNMVRKTHLRPMKSDSHAHRNRPEPLAMEMMPTSPAATMALTPVISSAMGAAWEMMAMPAVTLRNSSAHSAYHCQVRSASPTV